MFTTEQFKNLDLRKQLTEELKNKWYYQNYADALKINKKSVIFDDDFKFTLKPHGEEFALLQLNDETIEGFFYEYDEKYADSPYDILEDILLYIANYI